MPVKNGDKVKIEYTGTLVNGAVFDSSERLGKPLEFEVGAKKVIRGIENAILGMEMGEEKEVKISPAEAYGDPNPELNKKISRDQIPGDKKIEQGMTLIMSAPGGAQIPARILEVTDKEVTIDLNHPLAGQTLNFKFKVVDVS